MSPLTCHCVGLITQKEALGPLVPLAQATGPGLVPRMAWSRREECGPRGPRGPRPGRTRPATPGRDPAYDKRSAEAARAGIV